MADWTDGYMADIDYTYGYYAELNPLRAGFAFLNAGLSLPKSLAACELGFGQGVSCSLHAASSVTQWYGTDFNPAQAAHAQQLAAASGVDAQFYDEAFAEFCSRQDLPQFDFIGLHGIWSWISDENRRLIVDFLRRKLKVGGVLYISYNTQPGWAGMMPMRELMVEHAQVMGTSGTGIVSRVDASLAFAEQLLGTGARYGQANPFVAARLETMKAQSRNYLAHEYFNRDWSPMSFSKMHGWMKDAKLSYACSATYLEHVDAINLTPEQQQMLMEIPDRAFRETVRDFMVNQSFRRDYWVRGMQPLSALERVERLRSQRLVLVERPGDIEMKVTGMLGEAILHDTVYLPILDILGDFKVHELGEIERALEGRVSFAGLIQAMQILSGKGCVQMVQDEAAIEAAASNSARLNHELCTRARYSEAVSNLSSPVTGGGITVNRFEQIFLLASKEAPDDSVAWARALMQVLAASGRRLAIDGKVPDSPENEFAEAVRRANDFRLKRMPILKALRIAC